MKGPLEDLPTWALSQAAGRSHRLIQDRLRDAGFSGYDYRVIATLAATPGQSQAEIGRAIHLDRKDVADTVKSLVDRDLIVRSKDAADGRVMLAQLTARGMSAARKLDAVMTEIQDELLAPLDSGEAQLLVALLRRIGVEGEGESVRAE